jgi:UDPglucose--hexose-1-phosphate uridylyltransferase
VIAPGRARRPGVAARSAGVATGADPKDCPFCEGHEERTPPEAYAVAARPREPDTPGWTVRVVPNLYPALERQEVVVHSPRHVRSIAELDPIEIEAVTEAWKARAAVARADGLGYLHAFVNEGREAGASLTHSHSQLAWLPERPPEIVAEERARCSVCAWLERQGSDGSRVVADRDGLVVFAAYAGRLPYECLLAPREHPERSAFESDLLAPALSLLAETARRLHGLEGRVPLNAWLHDGSHWHVELVPRLSIFAGLELGAGVYVNTLAPEQAAERLRGGGATG